MTYICVLFAVVWVVLGVGEWEVGFGRVGCCYVCVCCESGFFVEMEGLGICVLCSADTCAS